MFKQVFLDRKKVLSQALMAMPIPGGVASSMGRGTHVTYASHAGTEVVGLEYEFWPLPVYRQHFGSNPSYNHTPVLFKGVQGMAVFHRPAGVMKVISYEKADAAKTTCLASTINDQELHTEETRLAFEQACDAFNRLF